MTGHLFDLFMLVLLQAVLGFDNLLYISLESKRAPAEKQKFVRITGIVVALVLRIILLFLILNLVEKLQSSFFDYHREGIIDVEMTGHALITLLGGIFIIYTAVKEVFHMIAMEEAHHEAKKPGSVGMIITSIVVMNLVFSFDSILSAMAITKVFWVMATAIAIGGVLMVVLSEVITEFLKKNRMYEVLGLFILFIVGIMLVTEGAHLAHLKLFGYEIHAMTKATFYFVIAILVLTDVIQGRYQKKLLRKKQALLENQTSKH